MTPTLLLFLAGMAVCGGVLAFGLFGLFRAIYRAAASKFRKPHPAGGNARWSKYRTRAVRVLSWGYFVAAVAGILIEHPWSDEIRLRNTGALKAQPPAAARSHVENWMVDEITRKLETQDTLFFLALSGGGSRAAYFDAAVLEQLRHIKVPGRNGTSLSLLQRIDAISTVSGGSIAGAYFVLYGPRTGATDKEIEDFIAKFKLAMSTDFERPLALRNVWPWRALSLLSAQHNLAETLADVIDDELLDGKNLQFDAVRSAEQAGAPLLLINATEVDDFGLLTFVPGEFAKPLYSATARPAQSGRTFQRVSADSDLIGPVVRTFGSALGSLDKFRIADAVAASAAYPFLGTIHLSEPSFGSRPKTRLGDGGLVDNSGLLSLYGQTFTRRLFAAAKDRTSHIVVIAIDAGDNDEDAGGFSIVSELDGIYSQAQRNVQRFVLPEMIRRLSEQDLADILEQPEWRQFEFPRPIVIRLTGCHSRGNPIPTALHLTKAERDVLDSAARTCVSHLQSDIDLRIKRLASPAPLYRGVFGPKDQSAWVSLQRLAMEEREWHLTHGSWRNVDDVKVDKPTGFSFQADESGGQLRLFATPVRYPETGWVSLLLSIDPPKPVPDTPLDLRTDGTQQGALEALGRAMDQMHAADRRKSDDRARFCFGLAGTVRGGDFAGTRANPNSPPFRPYILDAASVCG